MFLRLAHERSFRVYVEAKGGWGVASDKLGGPRLIETKYW